MKRALIAIVAALGLASAASAATVTVETDKANYTFGENIVITTTLTVVGGEAAVPTISLNLLWDGSLTVAQGPTVLPVITAFTGLFPWTKGTGNCPPAPGSCLTLDYISPVAPTPASPDAGVYVSTLTLVAGNTIGTLNFVVGPQTPTTVGAVPSLGPNMLAAQIVPEPGTAALLGLGLLGLGFAGRRR